MTPDSDTGTRLRSLYAATGGARSVFSAKVSDYSLSRPDYPAALFVALKEYAALGPHATVVDIGAGTGLLTQGLLPLCRQVFAVEPNPEMRRAADGFLGARGGQPSLDGCAESIPLASGSVHLIAAAQAFHWFEVERARAEFLRVLTADGQVALIWNDRVIQHPLNQALDEVFADFGGAKRSALVAHEDRSAVPRFFGSAQPREFAWPHAHRLDESGLQSLVFSRSYIPNRDTADGHAVAERTRGVFRRFAAGGTVEIHYRTVAIIGRPNPG